jgi:hypothetical protein
LLRAESLRIFAHAAVLLHAHLLAVGLAALNVPFFQRLALGQVFWTSWRVAFLGRKWQVPRVELKTVTFTLALKPSTVDLLALQK